MNGPAVDNGTPAETPRDELARLRERVRALEAAELASRRREARLVRHNALLAELTKGEPVERVGLDAVLRRVARAAAEGLDLDRAGVWLFDAARTKIVCAALYDRRRDLCMSGTALPREAAPRYFACLGEDRVIDAADAAHDPRTSELAEGYLKSEGVGALLDAPIRAFGRVFGVVCHEHVGGPRAWAPEDAGFAGAIADLAAVAVEDEHRRAAEVARAAGEDRLKHLVESLPVVVYSVNPRSRRTNYASAPVLGLTGYTAEEWIGEENRWKKSLHPEDRDFVVGRVREAFRVGAPLSLEYRMIRRDGAVRWVRDAFRVVRDAAGAPLLFQGVVEDVTEAEEARRGLHEADRRFRALLEGVPLLASIVDRTGRATFVNEQFLAVTGRTRAEVIDADWFELTMPPDHRERAREEFETALAANRLAATTEYDAVDAEGRRRRIVWTYIVLRDAAGAALGAAGLGIDLSERDRLRDRLQEAQRQESMGRLAAGAAHDFNNLLTVIGAHADDVASQAPAFSALARSAEAILSALGRAGEIVDQLLAFARRVPAEGGATAMNDLVAETEKMLRPTLRRGVTLASRLAADLPLARADFGRLQQVLVNLVLNAQDAMPDGGDIVVATDLRRVDEAAAATRREAAPGEYVVLEVSDTGAGIPPEVKDRIFDPFFSTKGGLGSGLGLSSAFGIVRRCGGHIAVDSTPGKGARFAVHLPRASDRPADVAAQSLSAKS